MISPANIEAIAQHIEAAACLIEESGWIRGRFVSDEKGTPLTEFHPKAMRFCIVGALITTSSDVIRIKFNGATSMQTNVARRVLCTFLQGSVTNWNDFYAKDKRDVVVHMLDCASALRKGEIKV